MSNIRDIAQNCEAKLHGFRRTQEGCVVSFVLHPQDVPQALALDPLGTRYMLAFVAISGDEQPAEPGTVAEPDPVPASQEKPWSDRSAAGKARYATSTKMQQAVVRAARYPDDARFRQWLGDVTSAQAAQQIRDECGIESRSEIATSRPAYDAFLRMETSYKFWAGLMPEIR